MPASKKRTNHRAASGPHHVVDRGRWVNMWHGLKIVKENANERFFTKEYLENIKSSKWRKYFSCNPPGFFPKVVSIQNPRKRYKDFLYILLNMRAALLCLFLGVIYFSAVTLFAVAFFLCGEEPAFSSTFNLSFQTFATIGYGVLYPSSRCANYVVLAESFFSLMTTSMITGLAFAKFAKPRAKIAWSNICVIQPYEENHLALVIRAANATNSHDVKQDVIMETFFRVTLLRIEKENDASDGLILCSYTLPLIQSHFITFRMGIALVHIIDEESPLYGMSKDMMLQEDMLLHVAMSGVDSTLQDTVTQSYMYTTCRIRWGERFIEMLHFSNSTIFLDFDKISCTESAPIDEQQYLTKKTTTSHLHPNHHHTHHEDDHKKNKYHKHSTTTTTTTTTTHSTPHHQHHSPPPPPHHQHHPHHVHRHHSHHRHHSDADMDKTLDNVLDISSNMTPRQDKSSFSSSDSQQSSFSFHGPRSSSYSTHVEPPQHQPTVYKKDSLFNTMDMVDFTSEEVTAREKYTLGSNNVHFPLRSENSNPSDLLTSEHLQRKKSSSMDLGMASRSSNEKQSSFHTSPTSNMENECNDYKLQMTEEILSPQSMYSGPSYMGISEYESGIVVRPFHIPNSFNVMDLYYKSLHIKWPPLFAAMVLGYFSMNVIFAAIFMIDSSDIQRLDVIEGSTFEKCIFFSAHTFSSIGYGVLSPGSEYQNFWVAVQSVLALVSATIVTGISWAKFARPRAHLLFSKKMLLSDFHGYRCLMFRAANTRRHGDIQECSFRVGVLVNDTKTGLRHLCDLPLQTGVWPSFSIPSTLVHVIDDKSPLRKITCLQDLEKYQISVIVLFTGLDKTFSESVYARKMYFWRDFELNVQFEDNAIMHPQHMIVDFTKFNSLLPRIDKL